MAGNRIRIASAWVMGVSLASVLPTAALAGTPLVTITGGSDETHHNYTWRVTNHHSARLVRIEFPHYRADLFHTPDSWNSELNNMATTGWKDRPGSCVATPTAPYPGLAPGGTAQFGMRIASGGALQGRGEVRVRFEDGTEATVEGVELPQQPERGTSYLALIGTGVIFALFIIYNERRRRRQPPVAPADET